MFLQLAILCKQENLRAIWHRCLDHFCQVEIIDDPSVWQYLPDVVIQMEVRLLVAIVAQDSPFVVADDLAVVRVSVKPTSVRLHLCGDELCAQLAQMQIKLVETKQRPLNLPFFNSLLGVPDVLCFKVNLEGLLLLWRCEIVFHLEEHRLEVIKSLGLTVPQQRLGRTTEVCLDMLLGQFNIGQRNQLSH